MRLPKKDYCPLEHMQEILSGKLMAVKAQSDLLSFSAEAGDRELPVMAPSVSVVVRISSFNVDMMTVMRLALNTANWITLCEK